MLGYTGSRYQIYGWYIKVNFRVPGVRCLLSGLKVLDRPYRSYKTYGFRFQGPKFPTFIPKLDT